MNVMRYLKTIVSTFFREKRMHMKLIQKTYNSVMANSFKNRAHILFASDGKNSPDFSTKTKIYNFCLDSFRIWAKNFYVLYPAVRTSKLCVLEIKIISFFVRFVIAQRIVWWEQLCTSTQWLKKLWMMWQKIMT